MKSLAGAFFAAINLLYAALFGGPIDGTAWDVKVKQEGLFHWTTRQETLIFHGGKVAIAGEVARGYAPALYEAKDEDNGTAFTLVMNDEGHDPVEWSGRVEGERITGSMVVHARDGRTLRYKFSGARKSG